MDNVEKEMGYEDIGQKPLHMACERVFVDDQSYGKVLVPSGQFEPDGLVLDDTATGKFYYIP